MNQLIQPIANLSSGLIIIISSLLFLITITLSFLSLNKLKKDPNRNQFIYTISKIITLLLVFTLTCGILIPTIYHQTHTSSVSGKIIHYKYHPFKSKMTIQTDDRKTQNIIITNEANHHIYQTQHHVKFLTQNNDAYQLKQWNHHSFKNTIHQYHVLLVIQGLLCVVSIISNLWYIITLPKKIKYRDDYYIISFILSFVFVIFTFVALLTSDQATQYTTVKGQIVQMKDQINNELNQSNKPYKVNVQERHGLITIVYPKRQKQPLYKNQQHQFIIDSKSHIEK